MVIAENACIETSALVAVVWYTYRNKRMLKISSIIGAIVEQTTAYFICIVVLHVYLQVYIVMHV